MGFEYIGTFARKLSEKEVADVLNLIALLPAYKVVSRNENSIALQYANAQAERKWSESIYIGLEEAHLYILFHIGPRLKIEQLLGALQQGLAFLNLQMDVAEL